MPNTRYLEAQILDDLRQKMVFLGGPRQVGKTTLARSLPGGASGYLNWDVAADRRLILARTFPQSTLLVFDELHKYRAWRNYLKGVFDAQAGHAEQTSILVTGSARLDWYRFGGDSLQGRYHYLRLHPLSVAELGGSRGALESLLRFGGFPEPFFRASERFSKRWSMEYRERLVREEIQSVERLLDLGRLELLMLSLPERVGSPLSINGLREDLQVTQPTVAHWLEVFERVYAIFRIAPFGAPKLRAVKKEQKHYHFDWTLIEKPGPRFENLVASHLLKWTHHQRDTEGNAYELRYFRDTDRREVDFVVVDGKKPRLAIECKWSAEKPDRGIAYLKGKFPELECWQISFEQRPHLVTDTGIHLASADELLGKLV